LDVTLTQQYGDRSTILVVDDTPSNLSLISEILEPHYMVKLVTSGERALSIASNHPIDLVLLDIMMPEMDGYEVCRRLKADQATRDIPVIFVTSVSKEGGKVDWRVLGAVDYITKPIEPELFLSIVRSRLPFRS
jgi:putative two-component system response regulator